MLHLVEAQLTDICKIFFCNWLKQKKKPPTNCWEFRPILTSSIQLHMGLWSMPINNTYNNWFNYKIKCSSLSLRTTTNSNKNPSLVAFSKWLPNHHIMLTVKPSNFKSPWQWSMYSMSNNFNVRSVHCNIQIADDGLREYFPFEKHFISIKCGIIVRTKRLHS